MPEDKKPYLPQVGDIVLYHMEVNKTIPAIVAGIATGSQTDVYLDVFGIGGVGGFGDTKSQGSGIDQYEPKKINPQLL